MTESHYRTVRWNSDGSLVAMDAALEGSNQPITIWCVGETTAEVVALPQELSLDWLLSREEAHNNTQWGMNFIETRGWTSTRELRIHAQGYGNFINPDTGKRMNFHLIYGVLLEIDAKQRCRISQLQRKHFAQSEFP